MIRNHNSDENNRILKTISNFIEYYLINNPLFFLLIIGVIGGLILAVFPIFTSLEIKNNIDYIALFSGALIIVAIIERSIELFITAWRTPERKSIERDISILKEQTFQSLPEEQKDRITAKKQEIKIIEDAIIEKKNEIILNEKTKDKQNEKLGLQQKIIDELADDSPDEKKKEENKKLDLINEKIDILKQANDKLEQEIIGLETKLQTLKNEHLLILLANPIFNDGSPQSELGNKLKELDTYRAITAKYALYLGLALGLFASIAGIRILEPLVDLSVFDGTEDIILKSQLKTFLKLDLLVSALAIAGGTKVFHGLPTLISDTLGTTRDQINAQRTQ